MSESPPNPPRPGQPRSLIRRLLPLIALVAIAAVGYFTLDKDSLFVALVRNLETVNAFVADHQNLAVLAYIGIYAAAVAVSLPGATFLTITGGFLFGLAIGAAAAMVGATIGATAIFLIARTALGETLLQRAGPRATQLARGFREDAFSYLLFLRLVPAFPFFLVNLVPAFVGVRLGTFVAATGIGIIPGAAAYAFAGSTLGSVIAAQKKVYDACVAAGSVDCHVTLTRDAVLKPEVIGALIVLGLLALVPVVVRRLRARRSAAL